jgi:carbon starvation protein CstA
MPAARRRQHALPLFGISNQMLAAVALILCTVVIFRMKRERYAWVTILPAGWLVACTLTAGLQKIAHRIRGSASWRTRTGSRTPPRRARSSPAQNAGQMSQIVWNDRIDAALAALFVLVVVSMIYYGVRACLGAYRVEWWTARETAPPPVDVAATAAADAAAAMR